MTPPVTTTPLDEAVAPPVSPPVSPRPTRRPLEVLIGAKVAAWVGAIVVVMGAALLIKLGIDEGLWGQLPVPVRALAIAAFGVALLAAGELALRRITRAASVGLFSAGLGVLYLDAMACATRFDLVPPGAAFLLMAVVAVAGFAITWRTKSRTIGVLSLIGGYATPLLLGLGTSDNLIVLFYLTALLGIALALSAVQPAVFRPLRFVALGGQILLGLIWFVVASGDRMAALVFASGWWTMVLVETLVAAAREQSGRANAVAMLVATAAYVSAGVVLIAPPATGLDWRGPFMLAVAVLGLATALQFGPSLDALRRRPRSALDKLAVALWAQSGVLVAVAIAIQFEGFGLTVGWLALVIAGVEMGRRLPSRGTEVFAFVLWTLTVAYLALVGLLIATGLGGVDGLESKLFRWSGFLVNRWSVAVGLALGVSIFAAHRFAGPLRTWRTLPVIMTFAAALGWMGMTAMQGSGLPITSAWIAGAVVLLGLGVLGVRGRVFEAGLLVLAASGGRWLLVDAIAPRLATGWDATGVRPFLNGQLAHAIVIATVAVGAGWAMTRSRLSERRAAGGGWSTLTAWIAVIASIVVLFGFTFEVDAMIQRAHDLGPYPRDLLRGLWFAGLWGIGGLAMTAVGRVSRHSLLTVCGWAITLAAVAAWATGGALLWRLGRSALDVSAFLNLQLAMAVTATLALLAAGRLVPATLHDTLRLSPRVIGAAAATVIALIAGSLEIERIFAGDAMATQAGLSVYWAFFGVGLVVAGFALRRALARYAGLALLTVTVGKVLFVDLATVERVWRVASFLVSGLLLVGTSVLYTKLSPRLLGGEDRVAG
ncbi:MAG: DUF2339 domain-containing protein [Phycisphaerales bacterium]|nr:DUF2339 domain-containing protein [Phycisphaerales bacterium]